MEPRLTENSRRCRLILWLTILSLTMLIAYSLTCLNPFIPVLQDIYNDTYRGRNGESLPLDLWTNLLSLTISLFIGGAFAGGLVVKYILIVLSRKQTMILLHVVHIFGILIVALAGGITWSYEAIIIGRFVMGFSGGLGLNTIAVIIAETCVHHKQGKYQSLTGFSIAFFAVLGPVMGHPKVLGTMDRWPFMISVAFIPSIAYLCCARWLPETPYSLLRTTGREEEVVMLLRKLRNGTEEGILQEIDMMKREQAGGGSRNKDALNSEGSVKINYVTFKGIFKKRQYRRQFLSVCVLYGTVALDGINHVALFTDVILLRAGIPEDVVTYVTISVLFVQACCGFLGLKLIAKFGNRKVLFWTYVFLFFSHGVTTIGLATKDLITPASPYISILGILMTLVGHSAGPNLAVFALIGEITTEPTRPVMVNYGASLLWFTAWLTSFIAPYMDEAFKEYSLLVWSGFLAFIIALVYFFIPETKGKSIDEIQDFFRK